MGTHADNDNFDPWSPIGLAALTILNRIQCGARLLEFADKEHDDGDEQREADKASHDYIQKRIAELRRFEQQANGVLPHRSRRKRE